MILHTFLAARDNDRRNAPNPAYIRVRTLDALMSLRSLVDWHDQQRIEHIAERYYAKFGG